MNILWYSTRGSAVVALILLTSVVVLGLLTSARWSSDRWPRFLSEELHRSLALSSLIFLGIHIVTAVIDPFTALGPLAALVPFAVDYRPLFLGLGSVAMYLLIALIATSLVRDRLGFRTWRTVHWLAYGFWPLALLHGIGTGTDSGSLWMLAVEIACLAAVGSALAWRLSVALENPRLRDLVPAPVPVHGSPMLNPVGFPEGPRLEVGQLSRTAPAATATPTPAAPTPAAPATAPATDPVAPAGRDAPVHASPPPATHHRAPTTADRLLSGPPAAAGAESLHDHAARLGPLPLRGPAMIDVVEQTGLLGRGGAGFPVGRKWRSVAQRASGDAVIVANGAEGKPTSRKDRALMALRPHLVIDGALIAADAVGADEVVFFIGTEHRPALEAMRSAVNTRRTGARVPIRVVEAPEGYVAGEASAAVRFIEDGHALPTMAPPRTFEAGVGGRPTVVQNVESLAYAALIARYGPDWYRSAGRGPTPGTALVTVSGTTPAQRVVEIEYGTTLGEVLERVGAWTTAGQGVMLGDSFGAWADVHAARGLPLDPQTMREQGLWFGAGVIAVIPQTVCGVEQTARTMAFMAAESAGQCGPCVFGLASIAEATARLAARRPEPGDVARLSRWGSELIGRGACAHPDGAAAFLSSGLRVFADEFELHAQGRCSLRTAPGQGDAARRAWS